MLIPKDAVILKTSSDKCCDLNLLRASNNYDVQATLQHEDRLAGFYTPLNRLENFFKKPSEDVHVIHCSLDEFKSDIERICASPENVLYVIEADGKDLIAYVPLSLYDALEGKGLIVKKEGAARKAAGLLLSYDIATDPLIDFMWGRGPSKTAGAVNDDLTTALPAESLPDHMDETVPSFLKPLMPMCQAHAHAKGNGGIGQFRDNAGAVCAVVTNPDLVEMLGDPEEMQAVLDAARQPEIKALFVNPEAGAFVKKFIRHLRRRNRLEEDSHHRLGALLPMNPEASVRDSADEQTPGCLRPLVSMWQAHAHAKGNGGIDAFNDDAGARCSIVTNPDVVEVLGDPEQTRVVMAAAQTPEVRVLFRNPEIMGFMRRFVRDLMP